MDSIFGVGLPELVLILILATMVMGPQRMRQAARQLGRWTNQLQGMTRAFTAQLNAELDDAEREDLKGAFDDIQQLRRQVADLRSELLNVARETDTDIKQTINPGIEALRQAQESLTNGQSEEATTSTGASATRAADTPPPALPQVIDVPDDPE